MIPTYRTLSEKAQVFECHTLDNLCNLYEQLSTLEAKGYFFRGQADASWKLYTAIQREWLINNLHNKADSIATFIQQHVEYQISNEAKQLQLSGEQLNDISVLSSLQHYGGPTPFLDFTSNSHNALYFATDNAPEAYKDEASQYFSIYAWQPGKGPATAATNDMWNWETVIDHSGGISGATSLRALENVSITFIKPESRIFLQIANPRLDLQNGLFVYAPKALRNNDPYEAMFDGQTIEDVVDSYGGLFIPRLVCLNITKALIPVIRNYLDVRGVTRESLWLDSTDWARQAYQAFLSTLN